MTRQVAVTVSLVVQVGGRQEFELDGIGFTQDEVEQLRTMPYPLDVDQWSGYQASEVLLSVESRLNDLASRGAIHWVPLTERLARFLGQAPRARIRVDSSPLATDPVRFYFAGRYGRRDQLAMFAGMVTEASGWESCATWLTGSDVIPCDQCAGRGLSILDSVCARCGGTGDVTEKDEARSRVLAQEDLRDVARADVVICATEAPGVRGGGRGGRHVELGYALALGKVVGVWGPIENIFCTCAHAQSYLIPDLLRQLKAVIDQ